MQSPCVSRLSPVVVTVSILQNNDWEGYIDEYAKLVVECDEDPGNLIQVTQAIVKQKIDDKVLCELMCCCTENTSTGGDENTNLKQGCVSAILQAADQALGHKSRYKAEISYNMDLETPGPFMHRDQSGQDTLQKSERWQTRARQEILGYKKGDGKVRRPDVIIVNDPSEPPYQKNIDRVVEMKFKGDRLNPEQRDAYVEISGGRNKLKIMKEGKECKCPEEDGEEQILEQFVEMPASEDSEEQSLDWGAVTETAGMAVSTAVGVVATVALIMSPFEGPAGDVAAGSATAAAAARTAAAFGRIFRPLPH